MKVNNLISRNAIIFAVILCYFGTLMYFNLNLPIKDDFIAIINPLFNFFASNSIWAEKVNFLGNQFMDHRLIFTELSSIIIVLVKGQLDFGWLIFIGNATLIGMFILFRSVLKKEGISLLHLLPISFMLFNPLAFESSFWAISSTNYKPVTLFGFLSIYFLIFGQKYSTVISIFFTVLSIYTFGNGLMIMPVAIGLLLLKKDFKILAYWLLGALPFAFMYFINYRFSTNLIFYNLLNNPINVLLNCFILLGSFLQPFEIQTHNISIADFPSILFGFSLFACLVYLFCKSSKNKKSNSNSIYFLSGALAFSCISIILFSLGRTWENTSIAYPRYRDFTIFVLVTVYVYFIIQYPNLEKRFYGYALLFSICLWASDYYRFLPQIVDIQNEKIAGLYNWQNNGTWLIYETLPFGAAIDNSSKIIDSKKNTFYKFPIIVKPILQHEWQNGLKISPKILFDKHSNNLSFSAEFGQNENIGTRAFTVFKNKNEYYLINMKREVSLIHFFETGYFFEKKYSVKINKNLLNRIGAFEIAVIIVDNNSRKLFLVNSKLPKNYV